MHTMIFYVNYKIIGHNTSIQYWNTFEITINIIEFGFDDAYLDKDAVWLQFDVIFWTYLHFQSQSHV